MKQVQFELSSVALTANSLGDRLQRFAGLSGMTSAPIRASLAEHGRTVYDAMPVEDWWRPAPF